MGRADSANHVPRYLKGAARTFYDDLREESEPLGYRMTEVSIDQLCERMSDKFITAGS